MDRTACGKYRIEELPRTDSVIEIEVSEFVLKLCINPCFDQCDSDDIT